MRRGRLPWALLAVGLVASACGGPPRPLTVSVREFPSDVILGDQSKPEVALPPPIPPTGIAIGGVGAVVGTFDNPLALPPAQGDAGRATTTPSPATTVATARACAPDDPLRAPAREASSRILAPPPAGSFSFRNQGTYAVSGSNPRTVPFPPASTRTVANVRTSSTGFTYQVAAELGGDITNTSYQVIAGSALPSQDGLYLVSITTRTADGRAGFPFTPAVPLKLIDLPAVPGTSFTTAGTDPTSGTTMSYTSTVGGKVRVDACGTPLDAISLRLEKGRLDGPDANVDFQITFALATQYGGVSIQDTLQQTGRRGADLTVAITNRATINQDPGG